MYLDIHFNNWENEGSFEIRSRAHFPYPFGFEIQNNELMSLKFLLHHIHLCITVILGIATPQQTYTVKCVIHDCNLEVLGLSFIKSFCCITLKEAL